MLIVFFLLPLQQIQYFTITMKRTILLILTVFLWTLAVSAQRGTFISSDRFSSSLISDICQDQRGSMWVATDYGLNRYDGYHFQTFLHDDADTTTMCTNVVVSLLCDRKGRLWVGTNRGLDRFDSADESFTHYPFPEGFKPRVTSIIQRHDGTILVGTAGYGAFSLGDDNRLHQFPIENVGQYFSRFFEDSRARLWKSGFDETIYMSNGSKVEKFHSTMGTPVAYAESNGDVLILCLHGFMTYSNGKMSDADIDMSAVANKDVVFSRMANGDDGTIYIGTRGRGVFRLSNTYPRKLEHVDFNAFGIDQRTAMISAAAFDRRGNLWLGCRHKGLLMLPQRPMQFNSWSFADQGIHLGTTVSSVCEGDNGMVWCTVQGVGVYGFNQQGQVVAHPSAPEAVEFIFRDALKRYWIGTDNALFGYDPLTGRSQQKLMFDCEKFNDMTCDAEGRIYISTFSRGFCVYNPATGSFLNHHFYEEDSVKGRLCNNWIMGMAVDLEGLVWMATSSGVSCYDPKSDSFRTQGWNTLLDGIVCYDVCELHSGQLSDNRSLAGCIAIGTEQGLFLYDRQKREVERFPGTEQLANKVVSYIVQANDGDIWCSTSMGIWQYQLRSQSLVGHVYGNGLTQKEYLYGIGMHTDDDVVYFGTNDGITVFSPSSVKESRPLPDSLHLVAFRVGDQYVNRRTELNGVRITDKAVDESGYFTLSYLDHTITLAFSQFNFDSPGNVIFEYRIDDGEWIRNPAGKNEYTISHLQPGTYRIETRALVGNDYTPVKVVIVTVRAPWYRSLLAYFIYFVVIVALLVYIQTTYRRRANEQMNEEKMKFLINATHDIRSPLTLIMSPLEKMKRVLRNTGQAAAVSEQNPDLLSSLDTIERNANRILNLVNQILDVRKIDKQQMQLHCQQTDLVGFIRGIYKMFEFAAKERNIDFTLTSDTETLDVWIDRNQFDKVVTNLLSNAFKYSYDGGSIALHLSSDGQNARLQVTDNGVGLDGDSLKHIFDRFYQGSNSRRMHIDGTGIGLNLCKMIVEMHHGTIEAGNRLGEKGSVFTVTLPLGNSHLAETEIEEVKTVEQHTATAGVKSQGTKRRVLIVDDDMEIGHYISTELAHYYKFGIAMNGKEGLKELLTNDYDVVVSDVMMPEMDGFTMLRMIKTNMNISHIPVIMLTSKADVANRLEGLERGADAFLAKPFDMEELHMNIENLIHNRQRLKGKFSGAQQQADKVEQPEVKGNDELLMERIMKAVNKNLADSDFNVDMLTQEVGISRAQLHRKMKELTGISTSEFIRNIRLEQAARLLREQKINVTQVAYTVGFSNLAHFSTIFRKHFGVSPSEYAERGNG